MKKTTNLGAGCSATTLDDWAGVKTKPDLPVDLGTEVEVECLDPGALLQGSSQLTCSDGPEFTYDKKPTCSAPGITNSTI